MKLTSKQILPCLIACLFGGAAATADWNPGQPYKYLQRPDVQAGMDVNATYNGQFPFVKVLADDWLCTSTDAVQDIHIWGSWLNDRLPLVPDATGALVPNPSAVRFKLSIHEDVRPAGSYSRPGAQVWSQVFAPGSFVARRWPFPSQPELFYEPNQNQIIGTDTEIWQYNFDHFLNPFIQQGTATNPKVYWLDVQAEPVGVANPAVPPSIFGWKTSRDSYAPNPFGITDDDAVFADTTSFAGPLLPGTTWRDMHYPTGPYAGQSINMAFVITPEPGTALLALSVLPMLRRRR